MWAAPSASRSSRIRKISLSFMQRGYLAGPVKWRGTRGENLLSDNHARDAVLDCALALDDYGNFTAVKTSVLAGMGGYFACNGANASIRNTSNGLPQVYRTPLSFTSVDCVMTNTAPVGPYRGAGREQASYIVERLIDETARQLGIDRVKLRRQNFIPKSAMPYRTPGGPALRQRRVRSHHGQGPRAGRLGWLSQKEEAELSLRTHTGTWHRLLYGVRRRLS